ncbi:hypothetical protein JCM3770_001492 [Rhodotorula araucariae]
MAEQLDPPTRAFLSGLPLLLAPLPLFSSSASHALSSLVQPVPVDAAHTACADCRAQLVGGVNASFWTEHGELWAACGGCGATSRRPRDSEAGMLAGGAGKVALERVNKRRRVEVKRRDEALHPTAHASAASQTARAEPDAVHLADVASTVAPDRGASALYEGAREPAPTPSSSVSAKVPSTASSHATTPLPATHSRPVPSSRLPSRSESARPTLTSSASSPVNPAPPAFAAPTPSLSVTVASKKRKRPKQPSGLAELLEAKKKREKAANASGTGLADFLQGL